MLGSVLMTLGITLGSLARASDFPSQSLTMIVPYAAGGSADVLGRVIAIEMGKILGQGVIVELKPGAGGNIGAEYVAKNVKPDGYTFLFASVSLATSPSLSKISFSPQNYITKSIIEDDGNIKEFVTALKANKIQASFGSSGNNTGSHLVGELFKASAGIDMTHVPYKGSGAVYPDLIAGRITTLFDVMGSSYAQVKGGQVRALAITSSTRSKLLPEVPTIAEQGYPGFEFGTWFGFFVPAQTPVDVRKKLETAILQSLKSESVKERLEMVGATPLPGPGADFEKWYLADVSRWAKMVREGRLQQLD